MLTLGYVSGKRSTTAQRKMNELAALIGRRAAIEIGARAYETYDELTQATFRGENDLAWLPPISFLVLVREGAIAPLAAARAVPYKSAIIVASDSPLAKPASLMGTRAAWVDRHSASGYVVPRIKLERLGIDPRTAFISEKFYETHDAVVAAVAQGNADFGATWARVEKNETTGPWSRSPHEVRVLATFGSIPPDVLAARADLTKPARKAIVEALKTIYEERQSRWLVRDVLNTEAFYRPRLELYGPLQEAVIDAYRSGLLGTPSPPPPAPEPRPKAERRLPMKAMEAQRRVEHNSVPDVVGDDGGADVDALLQATDTPPRWSLPEIDADIDVDVSFE